MEIIKQWTKILEPFRQELQCSLDILSKRFGDALDAYTGAVRQHHKNEAVYRKHIRRLQDRCSLLAECLADERDRSKGMADYGINGLFCADAEETERWTDFNSGKLIRIFARFRQFVKKLFMVD